ncbi:PepSY domain-containing protein [uncultured Sphingomonas sp.]|uniref:PepSY domain-containing protein n=1 Tax=uncultured Sphingomonas sp. TaxID=158754 RepID=UPI00262F480D|nr:PepSY domain-containing protein [uncultured Sphingomonas sp.]
MTATGATAAPHAKLSMAQARAIALKKAPGTVTKGEYEKEGGGWRYSFDIKQGARIHEIGVDANTGRIVEDKFERPGDKD